MWFIGLNYLQFIQRVKLLTIKKISSDKFILTFPIRFLIISLKYLLDDVIKTIISLENFE